MGEFFAALSLALLGALCAVVGVAMAVDLHRKDLHGLACFPAGFLGMGALLLAIAWEGFKGVFQ